MSLFLRSSLTLALCGAVLACAPRGRRVHVHDPDGKRRSTMATLDGRPHGEAVFYHRNGQISARGSYADGAKHGTFTYFDERGQFVKQEVYARGRRVWASADPEEVPPQRVADVEAAPVFDFPDKELNFATTDRVSGEDRSLIQLGIHRVPQSEGAVRGVRGELFTQHRLRGFSLYGQVSMAGLSADSQRGKVLLEVGGAREIRRLTPDLTYLVRGGAFFPLAGDDREGFDANSMLMYERLADAATAFPRSAGLRLSGSLMGRDGHLRYRADLGLDGALGILGEASSIAPSRAVNLVGRSNLAAGFVTQSLGGTVELTNVMVLNNSSVAERAAHSLAASLQLIHWSARPQIGIIGPLDAPLRGRAMILFVALEWIGWDT